MTKSNQDRPPLDFLGPYNVLRSEFPDHEVWAESDEIDELTIEEIYEVRSDVVAALARHGNVYGESEDEHDFFVYDDKFFDRTQKVELRTGERLPSILAPAVAELQIVLREHALWRVMFIGDGLDAQAREQFFVVYPDLVRIRQLQGEKTISDALVENAQLRFAHLRGRVEHQKQRNAELRAAIVEAFSEFEFSKDDAVLVAWFDTLSAPYSDWSWEGKPGTSAWVLLREPLPDDFDDILQSDIEFSIHWTTPDGGLSDGDDSRTSTVRQLLHFEDDEEKLSEVLFTLHGKRRRFTRPDATRR